VLTPEQKFFYKHAGYSFDTNTESKRQGKERCARRLARAERYAKRQDWHYEWTEDIDGCIGCDCGSADCACSTGTAHEVLVCVLRDSDDHVLGSLGSICEATREYGRVIEAELALEAMPRADR